jgi:alpha-tubulin suppressor-like RCC1 family protein
MYGWGYNDEDRLGFPETERNVIKPTLSTHFSSEHVVNVHCGRWQSVALTG